MSDNISSNTLEIALRTRVRCEYALIEQEIMRNNLSIVLTQIRNLELTGVSKIFPNQELIAAQVIAGFKDNRVINIMVVAQTQSGKTGSMEATIKKFMEDSGEPIPIENIYIITGLSSVEWKAQTIERLPDSVQSRVFHRGDLPKTFVDEIRNKQNVLIIMDEIQVAAKKGQTIRKSFEAAGLLDKQTLYRNDVKILEYTATPDGTIYDLMKWGNASKKIMAEAGENYVSSYDLYERGNVRQYKDLCGYDRHTHTIHPSIQNNVNELKQCIDSFETPRYHIIRTQNGSLHNITIDNIKSVLTPENYEYIKYDRTSEMNDINNTLIKKPKKHTIIFVKEMLRCAKTLIKTYLGVVYERHTMNPDDATIIQGLVGRTTGYDTNPYVICFTNIDSIIKYDTLWKSNFEDKTVQWKSKTTKFVRGNIQGCKTFNDTVGMVGFETDEPVVEIQTREPVITKRATQDEIKKYYNENLKPRLNGRGPNRKSPDSNGLFKATIRSNTRVYSWEEVRSERKQGLTDNNYRLYPCYENPSDSTTLEFWLIHY